MSDLRFGDPPERASRAPGPSSEQPRGTDELLRRLVRLVQDRASEVERSGPADEDPLGRLHEAVQALDQVVDAAALLLRAERDGGGPGSTAEATRAESEALAFARLEEAPAEVEAAPGSAPRDPRPRRGGETPVAHPEATTDGSEYPPFRDQLTGLHSREGFDAVASGELKRCRRHGRLFSLLLFSLPELDVEAIRRAARATSAATRESDLAGRHADLTLAVALPETPAGAARTVAERIIEQLAGVGAWDEEGRVGLVTHPAHGETLLHLLEAARGQLESPPQRVLANADRGGWSG